MCRVYSLVAVSLFLFVGVTMADDFRHIINEVFMKTNSLDMKRLYDQLHLHEGENLTCYYDSLNNPTVGKGHLVTPKDVIEIGDSISLAHSERLFQQDIEQAISDCRKLYSSFDTFAVSAKEALINMMYNIGYTKMRSFNQFNNTVMREDWGITAQFLRENFKKWYAQVKGRATDIEKMFRNAARGI
jgi:GH24 family phage-related lysozyme (muramidase)